MASPRTRFLATLSTLALITPATAVAGPDDGKHIATNTHVDSPKSFWENNHFVLKSEFGGQEPPIADTVAWVGEGYSATNNSNQYLYTLPANGTQDYIGALARLTTQRRTKYPVILRPFGWALAQMLPCPLTNFGMT